MAILVSPKLLMMPKTKFDFTDFRDNLYRELQKDGNKRVVDYVNFLNSYITARNIKLSSDELYSIKSTELVSRNFERVDDKINRITQIILSEDGIDFLEKYKTYSAYQKLKDEEAKEEQLRKNRTEIIENKKQEKKERRAVFSQRVKTWESLAAIIFGAATIVLSIFAIKQESNLSHIEKTLQQQSKKMDSIMQQMSNKRPNK